MLTPEQQAAVDAAVAAAATKAAEEKAAAVATAAAETRAALLKSFNVESEEALTALLAAGTQAVEASKTEAQKTAERLEALTNENKTLKQENKQTAAQLREVRLNSDAEELGAEMKVSAVKSRQILKLLPGFDASKYDSEKGKAELKALFTTFLAEPENKSFIGTATAADGSGRKPGSGQADNQHPLAHLRRLVTAAPISQ